MSVLRKKTIASVMALSMMASVIAGCSDDKSDKDRRDKDEETEVTTVETEETEVPETTVATETEPEETELPPVITGGFEGILQLKIDESYRPIYENDMYIGSINVDNVVLYPDYAMQCPELAGSLFISNGDYKDAFEARAIAMTENRDDVYVRSDVYVKRSSEGILSFVRVETEWADDEIDNIVCENYDIATGELLTNEDVFTDMNALANALNSVNAGVTSVDDMSSWVIEPEGVTVYVDYVPYFIAFEGNEELFVDGIGPVEGDYAMVMYDNQAFADIDHDGELESVSCTGIEGDYYELAGITIGVDQNSFDFEDVFCFSATSYLVRRDGNYYMYVVGSAENDYCTTYYYKLEANAVISVGNIGGRIDGCYAQGEPIFDTTDYLDEDEVNDWNDYFTGIMTDPSYFFISDRYHILSTVSASMAYEVSASGAPELIDSESSAVLTRPVVFTAISDIELTDMDGEPYPVQAGDKLVYIAVMPDEWAKFELEDGTIVIGYLAVPEDDWRYTLNGYAVDDVLAGTFFAG